MSIRISCIITAFVFLFLSCKKEEAECKLDYTEATIQHDGSVYLAAYFPEECAGGETGFCYRTDRIPEKNDNKIVVERIRGRITAKIPPGLDPDAIYYFRPWLKGKWRTHYGKTQPLTSIKPIPLHDCIPQPNTITISGYERIFFSSYPSKLSSQNNYPYFDKTFLTSIPQVWIRLSTPIKAGDFIISRDSSIANRAEVGFHPLPIVGPEPVAMHTGVVHVTSPMEKTYEIMICDARHKSPVRNEWMSVRLIVTED